MATLGYVKDDGDGKCCKERWFADGVNWRCTLDPGHDGEHVACGPPEENGPEEHIGKLPVYAKWRTIGEVST